MIKIAVDAMGGDNSVNTTVLGAMEAIKEFSDVEIYLYGDESKINELLTNKERIKVINTPKFMSMGEHDPVGYLRKNKDCSMASAMLSLKDGTCDACVTAGPTQCVIVGAHLFVRKLEGMQRVALCPIVPSYDGKGRLLLDVGANVELKAEHFKELAIAATIVSKTVLNNTNPRVGLINIGTEEGKGRAIDQEAYDILKNTPQINFYGNVEPNTILTSDCDIFVTDGFSGNLVLKSIEGTAKAMSKMLKEAIYTNTKSKIGGLLLKKQLGDFKTRLDSSEIGGAMILGAKAPVVKAHGSSTPKAFKNAIRQAITMVKGDIINKVKENLPKVGE